MISRRAQFGQVLLMRAVELCVDQGLPVDTDALNELVVLLERRGESAKVAKLRQFLNRSGQRDVRIVVIALFVLTLATERVAACYGWPGSRRSGSEGGIGACRGGEPHQDAKAQGLGEEG